MLHPPIGYIVFFFIAFLTAKIPVDGGLNSPTQRSDVNSELVGDVHYLCLVGHAGSGHHELLSLIKGIAETCHYTTYLEPRELRTIRYSSFAFDENVEILNYFNDVRAHTPRALVLELFLLPTMNDEHIYPSSKKIADYDGYNLVKHFEYLQQAVGSNISYLYLNSDFYQNVMSHPGKDMTIEQRAESTLLFQLAVLSMRSTIEDRHPASWRAIDKEWMQSATSLQQIAYALVQLLGLSSCNDQLLAEFTRKQLFESFQHEIPPQLVEAVHSNSLFWNTGDFVLPPALVNLPQQPPIWTVVTSEAERSSASGKSLTVPDTRFLHLVGLEGQGQVTIATGIKLIAESCGYNVHLSESSLRKGLLSNEVDHLSHYIRSIQRDGARNLIIESTPIRIDSHGQLSDDLALQYAHLFELFLPVKYIYLSGDFYQTVLNMDDDGRKSLLDRARAAASATNQILRMYAQMKRYDGNLWSRLDRDKWPRCEETNTSTHVHNMVDFLELRYCEIDEAVKNLLSGIEASRSRSKMTVPEDLEDYARQNGDLLRSIALPPDLKDATSESLLRSRVRITSNVSAGGEQEEQSNLIAEHSQTSVSPASNKRPLQYFHSRAAVCQSNNECNYNVSSSAGTVLFSPPNRQVHIPESAAFLQTNQQRFKFAYVTLLHGVDDTYNYRKYLLGCMVMAQALISLEVRADIVVLLGFSKDVVRNSPVIMRELALLLKLGVVIHFVPSFSPAAGGVDSLITEITLAKAVVWSLVQYEKIQFMDSDILPVNNTDCYFEVAPRTLFGIGSGSPLNAGWMILTPSLQDYAALKLLAEWRLRVVWDAAFGYGNIPFDDIPYSGLNAGSWKFYGADLEQGLFLKYFVGDIHDIAFISAHDRFVRLLSPNDSSVAFAHNSTISGKQNFSFNEFFLPFCPNAESIAFKFGHVHYGGQHRKPWLHREDEREEFTLWFKRLDELGLNINSKNIDPTFQEELRFV